MEIRSNPPKRSFSGIKFTTNKANKAHLAKDFQNRCAYCDDADSYSGGERNYHLEHFAPKSLFPQLKNTYDNLLYSCPFCNISKSDKWPSNNFNVSVVGNEGFLDPCENDYYKHIKRKSNGELYYVDDLGKYMYQHLSLGLLRHRCIYVLNQIDIRIERIEQIIKSNAIDEKHKNILSSLKNELLHYYRYYSKQLQNSNKVYVKV